MNQTELIKPCDFCEHACLFYCAHPKNWIQPFRYNQECDLFKSLPEGTSRAKVKNYLPCSICRKEFHIDDLIAKDKGSKMLCKNCK